MSHTATRPNLKSDPTLVALIPQLEDEGGHYYSYARAVEGASRRIGWNYLAALPRSSRLQSLPANWRKCLYTDRAHWKKQPPQAIRAIARQSLSIGRLLGSVAGSHGENFIVFVDFSDQGLLMALSLSLPFLRNKPSQIWIFCRFPTHGLLLNGLLLRLLSASLRRTLNPGRIVFLTDSELLQRSYARLLSRTPVVMPIPHTHFGPAPSQARRSSGVFSLWWPGEPREHKGLSIIQQLAGRSLDGNARFRLVVAETAGIQSVPNGVQVQTVANPLSEEEYANTLRRADMILLPYDARRYGEATSGVFVESVVFGKLPLVSRGTWMAFELEKFGLNELAIDWNDEQLYSLIADLSSRAATAEKFSQMRKAYCQLHNETRYASEMNRIYRGEGAGTRIGG
jgi:hypothetical protein